MANAFLTDDEKARIRAHLGYPSLQAIPSYTLGYPAISQPLFILEKSMDMVPESAIGIVRDRVAILDSIEQRLVEAMTRFKASKLDGIELRDNETDMLEREFTRWAARLSDCLSAPVNVFSERFRNGTIMGPMPMNIPVRH